MTAKQMGVNLEGEVHECKGCSMAIGLHMCIPKKTDKRADKRLSRVFVDLGERDVWRLLGETSTW